MYQALIIVHVLLALGIIALVLLQQGRGADAGAAFGSGASGTVFGAQGSATFLTRLTAVLATLFFATSLGLAVVGDTRKASEGFMDTLEKPVPTDLPPAQLDLNPPAVSDLPELRGDGGSATPEPMVAEPASPPAAETAAPREQPAGPEADGGEIKAPVPEQPKEQ